MFKTILVATDGSEQAEKALATACQLSSALGSDVHIVHCPQAEVHVITMGASAAAVPMPKDEIDRAADAVIAAAETAAGAAGCKIASSHVEMGDPAHVIQARAKAIGADLLISGRRGLGKIAGLLLGSVSQKLGQIAPCPHLTVT